ncbi:MAG: hypothetical protein ABGZ49_04485 [Akkermansiaceae bacterium]
MRIALLPLTWLICACSAEPPGKQRIELGTVQWQRDHDTALALSAKTGKPVFLLFQEVPG